MHPFKRLAINSGMYRPARLLHRALYGSERRALRDGLSLYGEFVQRGDLVFDIGANIGAKTEIFLLLGARVVAVEPQPEPVEEIRARCIGHEPNLIVVQKAVGAKAGRSILHMKRQSGQSSLLEQWEGVDAGEMVVELTTLDALIEQYGFPSFVKIDVEGFEDQVLAGLSKRLPCLTLEYHCSEEGARTMKTLVEYLAQSGSLLINATPEDGNRLLLSEWISGDEFLSKFPECVRPHYFGDLIIRTIN
jgi:FkbM family methyltransferase